MQIEVSQLRAVTERLLSYLEEDCNSTVELAEDYYWNIPEEYKYQVENDPKELDIGQLSEDWDFLRKVLESDREVIGEEYIWLGKILEAIGERTVR